MVVQPGFVSDLVGNHEDRFSRDGATLYVQVSSISQLFPIHPAGQPQPPEPVPPQPPEPEPATEIKAG